MAHVVCETTNLRAVHYAERIWDGVCGEDIDNGTFGHLTDLADGGVIYNFVKGAKAGAQVVMSHNPEWSADTSNRLNQRKDKFFIEKGIPFRCFTLAVGDEFALSEDGFVGAPEVGKFVTVDASGKLKVEDEEPKDAVMVGKIMRTRVVGSVVTTPIRNYGYSRKMYEVKVVTLA